MPALSYARPAAALTVLALPFATGAQEVTLKVVSGRQNDFWKTFAQDEIGR